MQLQDIYVYPIKSLGGIRLEEAVLEERGLKYDRRWMLIDKQGVFLTQRNIFRLALLQVGLTEKGLIVFPKNNPDSILEIPFLPNTEKYLEVTIWEDVVTGQIVDERISKWFSERIGIPCDLVFMPTKAERKLKPKYAVNHESVSFADGMPYMIIGQSSLNDLNGRLEDPVPMERFRPNLVFSGGAPFEEDSWDTLRIGKGNFKITKPCARCVLITIDQNSGERGKEPLRTLNTYRKLDNKVLFGQNMLLLNGGKVKVGDEVRGKVLKEPVDIKNFHVEKDFIPADKRADQL
jgi:uncharacterized protein YcbX